MAQVVFEKSKISQPFNITSWLSRSHPLVLTVYAGTSAFALYTCIYAYRKTFAAATFAGQSWLDIDLKTWLVLAQVVGYAYSKFYGIRIMAELNTAHRSKSIILICAVALFSWLMFAVLPSPWSIAMLIVNGLVLGLGWGMVFSYLEGRRITEWLGAALCVSFIFSSGLCRSVGSALLHDFDVTERWMPFVAGCLFFVPMLLFLYLLRQAPPPTEQDAAERSRRGPMDHQTRKNFVRTFLPGLILFIVAYVLLTAFRDLRDNFSAEFWTSLGHGTTSSIYAITEIPVSIVVLVVIASTAIIRKNFTALMINHVIVLIGMIFTGVGAYCFEHDIISAQTWMIVMGIGLYLAYVPFNSIFFDRMLATFKVVGTVGFVMYIADAFGYLGSVAVVAFKQFSPTEISWVKFFITTSYVISTGGFVLILLSMIYFYRKHQRYVRL